jgi:hypothetical protein
MRTLLLWPIPRERYYSEELITTVINLHRRASMRAVGSANVSGADHSSGGIGASADCVPRISSSVAA